MTDTRVPIAVFLDAPGTALDPTLEPVYVQSSDFQSVLEIARKNTFLHGALVSAQKKNPQSFATMGVHFGAARPAGFDPSVNASLVWDKTGVHAAIYIFVQNFDGYGLSEVIGHETICYLLGSTANPLYSLAEGFCAEIMVHLTNHLVSSTPIAPLMRSPGQSKPEADLTQFVVHDSKNNFDTEKMVQLLENWIQSGSLPQNYTFPAAAQSAPVTESSQLQSLPSNNANSDQSSEQQSEAQQAIYQQQLAQQQQAFAQQQEQQRELYAQQLAQQQQQLQNAYQQQLEQLRQQQLQSQQLAARQEQQQTSVQQSNGSAVKSVLGNVLSSYVGPGLQQLEMTGLNALFRRV